MDKILQFLFFRLLKTLVVIFLMKMLDTNVKHFHLTFCMTKYIFLFFSQFKLMKPASLKFSSSEKCSMQ